MSTDISNACANTDISVIDHYWALDVSDGLCYEVLTNFHL